MNKIIGRSLCIFAALAMLSTASFSETQNPDINYTPAPENVEIQEEDSTSYALSLITPLREDEHGQPTCKTVRKWTSKCEQRNLPFGGGTTTVCSYGWYPVTVCTKP